MSLHKQNTNGCEEVSKSAAVQKVQRFKMKTFLPVLIVKEVYVRDLVLGSD